MSPLTGSLEDYLEAIYHMVKRDQAAHSSDLAEKLNVKKSSVTMALRSLAQKKMIHYAPYRRITLTQQGELMAEDIVRRHEILKDFFVKVLAIQPKLAEENACRMEHHLSKEITDQLIRLMEFIDLCPRNGQDWLAHFHRQCGDQSKQRPCRACIDALTEKENHPMTVLSSLVPGQKAEIIKITHRGSFRKRILEMGVTSGALLTVERVAPLGDPIDIKIRGYHLTLRKEESNNIIIKVID
jgi:DtxR family Mn-dependent transcriptional regulator